MSIGCPYCKKESRPPDPEECANTETTYQHQCPHCDRRYVFTLEHCIEYYSRKADCLNDSAHDWVALKLAKWMPSYYENRRRCSICDEEKTLEQIAKDQITEKEL